jgi:hypothetical protein
MGAGGTILRPAKSYPNLEVRWAVFAGENPVRVEEAQRAAELFLAGIGKSKVTIYGFRDGFMPFQGELLKGLRLRQGSVHLGWKFLRRLARPIEQICRTTGK